RGVDQPEQPDQDETAADHNSAEPVPTFNRHRCRAYDAGFLRGSGGRLAPHDVAFGLRPRSSLDAVCGPGTVEGQQALSAVEVRVSTSRVADGLAVIARCAAMTLDEWGRYGSARSEFLQPSHQRRPASIDAACLVQRAATGVVRDPVHVDAVRQQQFDCATLPTGAGL